MHTGIAMLFILLYVGMPVSAQRRNTLYNKYIKEYAPLARKSNNHFGIKCHGWPGGKVYHDDDEKGECFRAYRKVEDSYEDHSQFLKNGPRYAFLFKLKITDYKGWAKGLKKAGYATDRSYANRLITIIEDYELYKYDTKGMSKREARLCRGARGGHLPPVGRRV